MERDKKNKINYYIELLCISRSFLLIEALGRSVAGSGISRSNLVFNSIMASQGEAGSCPLDPQDPWMGVGGPSMKRPGLQLSVPPMFVACSARLVVVDVTVVRNRGQLTQRGFTSSAASDLFQCNDVIFFFFFS